MFNSIRIGRNLSKNLNFSIHLRINSVSPQPLSPILASCHRLSKGGRAFTGSHRLPLILPVNTAYPFLCSKWKKLSKTKVLYCPVVIVVAVPGLRLGGKVQVPVGCHRNHLMVGRGNVLFRRSRILGSGMCEWGLLAIQRGG